MQIPAHLISEDATGLLTVTAPWHDAGRRVLCVAAHPDDEMACAGTLVKHIASGDEVMVIALADGVSSRGLPGKDIERRRQFLASLGILGVKKHAFGDWPDNQFDTVPALRIIKDIEQAIDYFRPEIVYTHHAKDLNVDHRITHEAVTVACRPQPGTSVKKLLFFEVPCSTTWGQDFKPNYFVDVSQTFNKKMEAWKQYTAEHRDFPHARSLVAIHALAEHRGCAIGVEKAEAFMVERIVA